MLQIILAVALVACPALALADTAPFWTQRSSYVEGEFFYGVGKASNAATEEEGRKEAFANAVQEITNYVRLTDLGNLPVETQMTYAFLRADKTLDVYRLIKVNNASLLALKDKQMKQAALFMDAMTLRSREEVAAKRKYLADRQAQATELKRIDTELDAINGVVNQLTANTYKRVAYGMTLSEVQRVMGNPRSMDSCGGTCFALNYGKVWVVMRGGVAICLSGDDLKCSRKLINSPR
mgnify:CR=1 FL=1